ncbi:hypothetical protein GCM10020254_49790 [Streptomyces goshikiensis]
MPDRQVARLIRAGAEGAYDHHFRKLAERLVDLGVPDTVIVLGWEMNGTTYTHRCAPDPENWKAYWRRVVKAMRSVPGQEFRFDFAPNRGKDAIGWTECYPGDDVVDIVGMDSYDQDPGRSFDDQVSQPYGLQQHVDFAKAHGKGISYPEWGAVQARGQPGVRTAHAEVDRAAQADLPHHHRLLPARRVAVQDEPAVLEGVPRRPGPGPARPGDPDAGDPHAGDPDAGRPHAGRPHAGRPDARGADAADPDAAGPHAADPEARGPDPVAGGPGTGQPEPGRPQPGRPEPGGPGTGQPEPGRAEPGRPEPRSPGPGQPRPRRARSGRPEPGRPQPGRPEPRGPGAGQPRPGRHARPCPRPRAPAREPGSECQPEYEAESEAESGRTEAGSRADHAPAPPPVNSKQWCMPLNFGEWLSKLIGAQSLCVKFDWGKDSGFWPF